MKDSTINISIVHKKEKGKQRERFRQHISKYEQSGTGKRNICYRWKSSPITNGLSEMETSARRWRRDNISKNVRIERLTSFDSSRLNSGWSVTNKVECSASENPIRLWCNSRISIPGHEFAIWRDVNDDKNQKRKKKIEWSWMSHKDFSISTDTESICISL